MAHPDWACFHRLADFTGSSSLFRAVGTDHGMENTLDPEEPRKYLEAGVLSWNMGM
jgi:hypothetical protein